MQDPDTIKVNEQVEVHGDWLKGITTYQSGRTQRWIKLTEKSWKKTFWFIDPDVLEKYCKLSISDGKKQQLLTKIQKIEDYYYIFAICDSYSNIKISNKPISEIVTDLIISMGWVNYDALYKTLGFIVENNIDKTHTQSILRIFLAGNVPDKGDYQNKSSSEVDSVIQKVLKENQSKTFKDDATKTNFLVGQVLKVLGKKTTPQAVKDKIMVILNI